MMPTLKYEKTPASTFSDLVAKYPPDQFKSPRRSTVPLLAFWRNKAMQDSFFRQLSIPLPKTAELCFEYEVEVQGGKGKPSYTDLMILADGLVMAVEAKHTEPKYESVETWLGDPPSENKNKVLTGWLELINNATSSSLKIDDVLPITYQCIHRTASACMPMKEKNGVKRYIVYQYFIDKDKHTDLYEDDLTMLRELTANSNLTPALLVCKMNIEKSPTYKTLTNEWDKAKRKTGLDFSDKVKSGLSQDGFIAFEEPTLWKR